MSNLDFESLFTRPIFFKRLVQILFFATLSNLILVRIISRFGMHLPQQVRKAPFIMFAFRSIFFLGTVMSYLSIGLVLISLAYIIYQKLKSGKKVDLAISFLLLFLISTSILSYVMNTNISTTFINDLASVTLILLLSFSSLSILRKISEKIMVILLGLAYLCFFYFKVSQGLFMVIEIGGSPPFISRMIGFAELFIILSIFPLFFAYSDIFPGRTSDLLAKGNKKILILPSLISLFIFVIDLIDPYALAIIGTWALGLTLYLPPLVYIIVSWLFVYALIRCLLNGKPIGYAMGLIYFSGFAISLSLELLTLILGFSLINTGWIESHGKETYV